jgi:hypothetical protein
LAIEHSGHEYSSAAFLAWAFASETMDFTVLVHLVIFKHGELDFLVLMLGLFRGGVILLLALLATTAETKNQMESGFWRKSK